MRKVAVLAGPVVSAFMILACASNAGAQSTPSEQVGASAGQPQPGPDATTAPNGAVLATDQDIIVTARKRGERLQDVPASIAAVGSAELQRFATNSISSISTRVPQLQVGTVSGPGGGSINLRGIGSPGTSPSVDQAVSINIDGVQISQGNAITLGIFDLDRVEVLKGPQALFYGKNSLGGIISLISADPGREFEWLARGGYDFSQHRQLYEGMVSVPLTDGLGFRVDAAYTPQKGYFLNRLEDIPGSTGASSNRAPDQRDLFARGTLKYDGNGGPFDATLKASYARSNRDSSLGGQTQLFSCPLGAPQLQVFAGNTNGINDCTLNRITVDPKVSKAVAATDPYYFGDGGTYFKQRQFLTSLQLNYKLTDELKLSSVTGYYDYHERWDWNVSSGEIESLDTAARVSNKQFTQELRLASSFKFPLNFVAGGFYQNATQRFEAPLIFTGFLTGFTAPLVFTDDRFRQKTEAWSVFGQGILDITDQLELTGGGRFSHEEKSLRDLRYFSAMNGFSMTPVSLPISPDDVTFHNFSPEVTLRYQPTRDVTLFGAYRQGFTSGGFNEAPSSPGGNITYRQATARGFEIGAKGSFFDRQLSFDTSIYTYKYDNLQLNAFDPTSVSVQVRNAASARAKGVEAALTFTPRAVTGLALRSNVAYNHARYLNYPNAPCYAGESVGQGCNGTLVPRFDSTTGASLGSSFSTQNLSGTQLERAPDWTMSYGFSYELLIGDAMKLSFGGDENYTSSYQPEPGHNPRARQPSVWRLNAFVALAGSNNGWELSLIGRNLTNKLRALTAFEYPVTGAAFPGLATPGLGADIAGAPTEPRAVMLQLTVRSSLFKR